MPSLGQRLIAYGFVGSFCIAGPLLLLIAIGSAVNRAVFIHSALRAEGTIVELRPTRSTRTGAGAYVPVVSFTADALTSLTLAPQIREHTAVMAWLGRCTL